MTPHPSSFRDPRGFVFEHGGVLYRQVNEAGRGGYETLMAGGLYAELVAKRLLVAHEEVGSPVGAPGAIRVLKPELVPFISHPYEWSFGQLKAAALTTLRIQRIALKHGASLRDASAFNVQFVGAQPVFIDTLSFDRYEEGRPWEAYRQFCQHFLAPLYLAAGRDPRLGVLSSSWIDGIPLDVARMLAPRRYRWRPGFFTHVSLHARAQRRWQDAADRPAPRAPRLARGALLNLLDSLRGAVEHLDWNPDRTVWAGYYANTNYTDAAMEQKKRFVGAVARATAPARVVDLGANTGEFSAIAAEAGAYVVASDVDHGAVEICFRRESGRKGRSILPLVVDLASPPPAVGWMNRERPSFLDRCGGTTDLVLALALVHHLAIGNNVPLRSFFELLARVGRQAVVEFVGKDDSQVRRLLASREDIFPDYTEAGFERALAGTFTVARREPIEGTHRVLYHLVRR